ncbi:MULTISPECIES: ABC transporter ATP-binding protein [unclassified Novosphingobium]|uniref:ABC transporter ATP-binding protein n=1 Tax=unclassified Novosphingobium TaxID=2644732 RepID=UPI00146C0441|nr:MULTISPECIES: ABC transporter ATP-binding protein [unclassified Novosphingobium]NMN03190.1 capsular polysaccharide transport system ATP-binding protein [Novosphingobium sp. SG919]NMN86820.1 capsular polysaccharide transport system ATP-binding protein [Novosphingobium sp. SG916]
MIICKNLHKSYKSGHRRKDVLVGVDLEIGKGERIGLLGRNGAGKTTLIKLIGGVEHPTKGRVIRNMSVSWPLGFAGGFQGSLTGLDNARFIARIYGRDYRELRDFVEDFSELGAHLKQPTKTYSSGMRARLAFALSLAIEFDCYLIDEVIMVGDQSFQRKCHYELFEKRTDRTLFLASHGVDIVRNFCHRAVVLDQGKAHEFDDMEAALALYDTF